MFHKLSILFCMILCLAILTMPCSAMADGAATFAGGFGTEDDAWQIENAEQFLAINNDLSASYILIADIDLSGYELL